MRIRPARGRLGAGVAGTEVVERARARGRGRIGCDRAVGRDERLVVVRRRAQVALFRRSAIFALKEVNGALFAEIVGVLSALEHKEEHAAERYGANDATDNAAYDPSGITVGFPGDPLAREPPIQYGVHSLPAAAAESNDIVRKGDAHSKAKTTDLPLGVDVAVVVVVTNPPAAGPGVDEAADPSRHDVSEP